MTPQIRRRTVSADHGAWGEALHPVLRRAYAARGICDAAQLSTELSRLLPVGSLGGVAAAVELLLQHRERGRILVVGDFDADGATSTALMLRALRAWGFGHVDFLVPNRFEFGYGLTPEIVVVAAARKPTLLVTVDNGISSIAGVASARALGLDVLVTDHHLPAQQLPQANVIVNPNAGGDEFASRCLAGVGVAFYVLAAVKRTLDERNLTPPGAPGVADFLDLVALGTVADLVPLDANNRVLVAQGLRRIRAGRCVPGITALLEVAQRRRADLTATDLGFAVAPRLNAAGRLEDMTIGIQCLLTDEVHTATALALRLDGINRERRQIEARMQADALAALRGLDDPLRRAAQRNGLCLFDESWHQGVVGLVASRIKDRTGRPVIAFARAGDGVLRGSARSVAGLHIRDVLDAIATRQPELIARFGGHAMAAGMTLDAAKLDEFAAAFDQEVTRWAQVAGFSTCIETDGELTVAELALETATALRAGGPWGQLFPEPTFDGVFNVRNTRIVGERHVKMWVEVPHTGRAFDAIAFNFLDAADAGGATQLPSGEVHLVYRLDINEYQNQRRLQLLVDKVLTPQSC
ncbi:MAG TPA: single-stranded-DNA-specific exonuclease RecJ [Steroidobacteraceae bacterium]|nr:single-stranded-DNA-specific exonuclease RecJ [Steroidobacteraceae bacterium]